MSIFSQYTPYKLSNGGWTEEKKKDYANLGMDMKFPLHYHSERVCYCNASVLSAVFDCIEAYAPGFKKTVVGHEVLTPPDLERIFGLTGGNIFHGAMSVDQLYLARPSPFNTGYSSRGVQGLFLCGSGAHPGDGNIVA